MIRVIIHVKLQLLLEHWKVLVFWKLMNMVCMNIVVCVCVCVCACACVCVCMCMCACVVYMQS